LVFRQKERFRSDALVLAGRQVSWDDLATKGTDDADAVRVLTDRIADALRAVTVNLERWQDQPLVECGVRVWEAERGVPPAPAEHLARLDVTTRILATVRADAEPTGAALARDLDTYRRRIERLRLRPADLTANVGLSRGFSWAARRVPLVMPLAAAIALSGLVLFWVPYQLTGLAAGGAKRPEDQRATYKLLFGIGIYAFWVLGLTMAAALTVNVATALLVLVGAPILGMAGLVVRERWRGAWSDARRFLLLNGRRALADALRARQRELGARLDGLYQMFATRGVV
jgi:hypothetical protein